MNNYTSKFSTIVKTIIICNCLFLLTGCNSFNESITDFDSTKWAENKLIDQNNCIPYRSQIYKTIINEQKKLIGISEIEATNLFGKPDQVHISKRMRKSVFYCINGCNSCDSIQDKKYLVIDFETLRRVKTIRTSFATE